VSNPDASPAAGFPATVSKANEEKRVALCQQTAVSSSYGKRKKTIMKTYSAALVTGASSGVGEAFALLTVLDWHLSALGWDRIAPTGEYVWLSGESAEEISPFVSSVVLESGP
jgi:hypothetical protein